MQQNLVKTSNPPLTTTAFTKTQKNTAMDKTRNETVYNFGVDFKNISGFERVEVVCWDHGCDMK